MFSLFRCSYLFRPTIPLRMICKQHLVMSSSTNTCEYEVESNAVSCISFLWPLSMFMLNLIEVCNMYEIVHPWLTGLTITNHNWWTYLNLINKDLHIECLQINDYDRIRLNALDVHWCLVSVEKRSRWMLVESKSKT